MKTIKQRVAIATLLGWTRLEVSKTEQNLYRHDYPPHIWGVRPDNKGQYNPTELVPDWPSDLSKTLNAVLALVGNDESKLKEYDALLGEIMKRSPRVVHGKMPIFSRVWFAHPSDHCEALLRLHGLWEPEEDSTAIIIK